jgi:hypothetical protein
MVAAGTLVYNKTMISTLCSVQEERQMVSMVPVVCETSGPERMGGDVGVQIEALGGRKSGRSFLTTSCRCHAIL